MEKLVYTGNVVLWLWLSFTYYKYIISIPSDNLPSVCMYTYMYVQWRLNQLDRLEFDFFDHTIPFYTSSYFLPGFISMVCTWEWVSSWIHSIVCFFASSDHLPSETAINMLVTLDPYWYWGTKIKVVLLWTFTVSSQILKKYKYSQKEKKESKCTNR